MTSDARQEKRVGLRLCVDISGQDAGDVAFAHSAQTLNISGGVVCFETPGRRFVAVGLSGDMIDGLHPSPARSMVRGSRERS